MADKPFISSLKFRGANLEFMKCKAHEAIICSPADTGKTVAATYSVVKTFKRLIRGLGVKEMGGSRIDKFVFANGSEIVLVGCDKPDKILSSEWDTIQVCQSEELTEAEWEICASRVTGRGGVFAHPQIFGDCNPSAQSHWIRKRKSLKLITGSRKDNPELYDDQGSLTKEGERREKLADQMYTGIRRKRLFDGIWATAEGAVYDSFSPEIHVKVRERSEMKAFHLAIDDGYVNPAVILDIGEDSDGRWHVFRMFYHRAQARETVVRTAAEWHREFQRYNCAVDAAVPELVAALLSSGVPARGGKGKVLDGIRKIQNRLQVQGDGKPRLTIDPSCVDMINECESYCWKKDVGGISKDEPQKEHDHSLDALRYLEDVIAESTSFSSADAFKGGVVGIEEEPLGDAVLTAEDFL